MIAVLTAVHSEVDNDAWFLNLEVLIYRILSEPITDTQQNLALQKLFTICLLVSVPFPEVSQTNAIANFWKGR